MKRLIRFLPIDGCGRKNSRAWRIDGDYGREYKSLHAALMRGVYDNAGFYSDKIRVMGKLAGMQTTLPEDIPEEVNGWVYRIERRIKSG